MITNNLKLAWRNLINGRMHSAITIGGFSIGIASCLLITFFIKDELSYDKYFPDAANIYRVVGEYHVNGEVIKGTTFPAPFAKTLKESFPEVKLAARINASEVSGVGNIELKRADQKQSTYEVGVAYTDQDFIDMLQISFVYGNPENALAQPNSIVISKRKADKYFPNQNPIGKTVILNNNEAKPYTIGGVMANFPQNSHLKYDFFITLKDVELFSGEKTNWLSNNYDNYISVRPKTNIKSLAAKFSKIAQSFIIPAYVDAGFLNADGSKDILTFYLQPISDVHLKSEGIEDGLRHGDIRFIWIFGAIAIFILLLACINFINLSTARSANRAKEVGLRKTIGSSRIYLVDQFLTESILYSLFSFILGILLAWALLPFFNVLSEKSLDLPITEIWLIPVLLFSAIIVGLLSGLYPSFYLSSFKPVSVLKGNLSLGSKNFVIRSGLVIFQFTASIILIIGTLIIKEQMGYIMHKKLGFEKEQVLMLHGTKTMGEKVFAFKEQLLKIGSVKSVTISDYLPVEGTSRSNYGWWKEGKTKEDMAVTGQQWIVDSDYIKTMGMKLAEGKDFLVDVSEDAQGIIINESLKKKLGLENPIGKRITNSFSTWEIIGIVEDFNFESLRSEIQPLALIVGESASILSVRFNATDISSLLSSVNSIWNEYSPNQDIRYSFLDEKFALMHQDVERMGQVFISFSFLAIVVACLGLFGLITFATQQKRKEISIRKINGARISEIVVLINKETIKWVAIAFVIATPIAWYAMNKWLQNFAYKTELSWWIFALAGVLALGIALLTASWQSWRAATRNPVEALRSE